MAYIVFGVILGGGKRIWGVLDFQVWISEVGVGALCIFWGLKEKFNITTIMRSP